MQSGDPWRARGLVANPPVVGRVFRRRDLARSPIRGGDSKACIFRLCRRPPSPFVGHLGNGDDLGHKIPPVRDGVIGPDRARPPPSGLVNPALNRAP